MSNFLSHKSLRHKGRFWPFGNIRPIHRLTSKLAAAWHAVTSGLASILRKQGASRPSIDASLAAAWPDDPAREFLVQLNQV